MESVELSAKSVEEAIQQALIRLGKSRDEVEITVLSEGHKGILGFVRGDNARVRVTVREPSSPAASGPRTPEPRPRAASTPPRGPSASPRGPGVTPRASNASPRPSGPPPRAEDSAPRVEDTPAGAVDDVPRAVPRPSDAAVVAKDTMEELLEKMGIDADVIFRGGEGGDDSPILLDIQGEDLGILIGRRGETLASLQFLANLMVGKRLESWVRVLIDVEGYRARREEALRSLAERVAERVRRTGQPVALEPMPANERRIVHMALQTNPHVGTESSGVGEERRVNVVPRSKLGPRG